mgnify:FL=1
MTIGENIKRIRERNNLTQKQLAYLSHISEGMIKQYETNVRTPKQDKVNQIAAALDVNPEVLAVPKNVVGEDMHALFRVFRNKNGKFDTAGNPQFNLPDIALWFDEWKKYQNTIANADLLSDKTERDALIAQAEDRFNYWMDIYPRSASLNHSFDDLYEEHRRKIEKSSRK